MSANSGTNPRIGRLLLSEVPVCRTQTSWHTPRSCQRRLIRLYVYKICRFHKNVCFICEFLFTFACFISYLSFILLASFLIRLSFFIALCFIHSIAYPLLCVLICVSYSFYCIFQMFHSICVASFHFPLSVGS